MEVLREGLPILLGAAVPFPVMALARAGLGRVRHHLTALLVLTAGVSASALNGELAFWPAALLAIIVDSGLAYLGAVLCTRVVWRQWLMPDPRAARSY
jgi:hypothetical protein